MIENITPEQRQVYLQQAQESRKAKVEWANINLDMDWGDDEKHWKELGTLYSVKLPQRTIPNTTTKYAKRLVAKLGADMQEYLEYSGCRTLTELVKLNPRENALSFCGLILEWYDEKRTEVIEFDED